VCGVRLAIVVADACLCLVCKYCAKQGRMPEYFAYLDDVGIVPFGRPDS
jgi:hypothetical protein